MIDLSNPEDRKKLELQIEDDINKHCEEFYEQGHRNHLGASELGDPCWRNLYYIFRWMKAEHFNGRMMRLFNVGNQAEPRFVDYLRAIGFEVQDKDPATGKQFRVTDHQGHYGGGLDGRCKAPARYEISEDLVFLNEFKTNNTGRGYESVRTDGVAKAKAKHYKQMSQYGYKMWLRYGIYMIENKNDSSLTVKIVELDWNIGRQMVDKAGKIIFAKEPPAKISENPAFQDCVYCARRDICHYGAEAEVNCRSCRSASPVENGEWHCSRFNQNIPKDFIPKGCPSHTPI